MNFDAYLFDMDGTLATNERLKGEALAKTCNALGAEASSSLYKSVMGHSWEFVRQHFCDTYGISPTPEKFDTEFKVFYKNLLINDLESTAGATKIIHSLKYENKKLGLVSSAYRWMVDMTIATLGFTDQFDVIISQENVKEHKPHPEAYLLALKKLKTRADRTLIFEDSESGIKAGINAGCHVVAIQHEFNVNQNLKMAARIISSFDEFILD
ncbi:MAG: HAD family phosphatase [Calditrichaeota bacterium]|nr:MAG: HAD family phosphatase [Calditrichota bacterium]